MTNVSAFMVLVAAFASPVASASDWPQTDIFFSGSGTLPRTFTLENRNGHCFVLVHPGGKAIDMNISAPWRIDYPA